MIFGVQFIAIVFSLLMLYITYLHFKKGELSLIEEIIFSIIWIVAIVLMIFPESANFILKTFHIYRLLDLATIIGFIFLVAISFKNYLELKNLRKKIEKIVRNYSLQSCKNK
jgi:hypothetical protein